MNKKDMPSDAWYTQDGPDSDVALSSRVRVARNLEGFRFPASIHPDDGERVQSLVFDALGKVGLAEQYQRVRISDMDALGRRILSERGVIEADCGSDPWRACSVRNDGVVSLTVNMEDHLRISSFSTGLSLNDAARATVGLERELSKSLAFSSTSGFGFLTSSIANAGQAMRLSVLLSLSGLCMNGLIERVIRDYLAQGFIVRGYYGQRDSVSLGCVYQLSNYHSMAPDIDSLVVSMEQAAGKLVELERKSRNDLVTTKPTLVEDTVFRAVVAAKYARFLSFAEAIDLIQRIRLGVYAGLITGVGYTDIASLLYRTQNAHISFIISGGSIIIEDDVATEELKMDRLRAMIVQEVLKDADIKERRK